MRATVKWDPRKADQNRKKHGVTFEEAATVFEDTLSFTISDPFHSSDEERFILIGRSVRGRLLVVVHTDIDEIVRIISVREANPHERRIYEEGT